MMPSYSPRWIIPTMISLLTLLSIGASGSILSLSTSGGDGYSQDITINTTVQADDKVNNSNFYFELRAPDGTVITTHNHDLPRLEGGTTYNYSWSSNNASYPVQGNYSVTLCWSAGGSGQCQLGSVTTGFYSVSTLGRILPVVLVMLAAIWVLRMRRKANVQ